MLHASLSPLVAAPSVRTRGRADRQAPAAPRTRDAVKALVTATDSVLLVRERHADGSHFWTLPGGGVHAGEHPSTALERELREELRCGCVVGDPVCTFPYAHTSRPALSLYTVHECRLVSEPEPVTAEGVIEYRWATPDEIPPRTLPQVRAIVERPPSLRRRRRRWSTRT